METGGVSRRDIHPAARLEEIIPPDRRRIVWKQLSKDGLSLPGLSLSPSMERISWAALAVKTVCAGVWGLNILTFLTLVPLAVLTWRASRTWAVHIRTGPVTIWDAVIYLTPYRGNESYPWSHEEISTKVRLIISESLAMPLEKVQPESRWIEDLGAG